MRTTRRGFNRGLVAAAGGALALPVLSSCGRGPGGMSAKLPDEAFSIGGPEQYLNPGVYRTFRESHQVYLHSNGTFLAVLAAVCPHSFCLVKFDDLSGHYVCPCHHSRFDEHGLVQKGSASKTSLERCRVFAGVEEGRTVIVVDPTVRYRFETEGDWSRSGSMFALRELPGDEATKQRTLPWRF